MSLIVTATHAPRRVLRNVWRTLEDADLEDLEVVVVIQSDDLAFQLDLVAGLVFVPQVTVLVTATDNAAEARNRGAAAASHARLVFLDGDIDVVEGWLHQVVRELDGGAVLGSQPVLLRADYTIHSAGIGASAGAVGVEPVLAGHPAEDCALATDVRVPAITGSAFAMRATDFHEMGGFDTAYLRDRWDVDLCLRLREARGGHFVVAAGTPLVKRDEPPREPDDDRRLLARWAALLSTTPTTELPPAPTAHHPTAGPRLRWGLRIASTPGPYGDKWGDTHFAASLAGALRELGQHVVTYRRGFHTGPGTALDDVVLTLRGLERVDPLPGKVNVLWVISHPEDVTPAELEGFDLVYAASEQWACSMTAASGRHVEPLLQATEVTDPAVLDCREAGGGPTAVFVGSALTRRRQVVHDALEAGIDVAVYGPGWRGEIPARAYAGEYLPNDLVARTYHEHGLVLADHWPDMAAAGFVANRVFDAVAAGARVISDPVPGITELFHGAVRTYSTPAELHDLAASPTSFPSPARMREIALQTEREHSFHARAAQLLGDVASLMHTGGRRSLPGHRA